MALRSLPSLLAASFFALAPIGEAAAACLQTDLTGKWQMYVLLIDDVGGDWARCRLSLTSSGTITQALSSCRSREGQTSAASGSLKVTDGANCVVTGSLRAFSVTSTVRHATLSRDKITLQGVGDGTDTIFAFNASKI